MIRYFKEHHVCLDSEWNMIDLFSRFTYLDGSPVGIEEESL